LPLGAGSDAVSQCVELLDIGASDDEPLVEVPLFIEPLVDFLCFIDLVFEPLLVMLSLLFMEPLVELLPLIEPLAEPFVIEPLVLEVLLFCMAPPCCMLLSCELVGGGVLVGVVDCCANAPADRHSRSEKPIGLMERMGNPSM
jgi:hypothetical protein